MSLNKMMLTPKMLVDFYADILVENNPTQITESLINNPAGSNSSDILIITDHVAESDGPVLELSLLNSILSACSIGMNDVVLCHFLPNNPIKTIEAFLDKAKIVLLFGVDPLSIGLPIRFPQFQKQYFDKRTYLYAPSLTELYENKKKKTMLWTSLKNVFGIDT